MHVIVRVPLGQLYEGQVVYQFIVTDLEYDTHFKAYEALVRFEGLGENITDFAVYEATLTDVMEIYVTPEGRIDFVEATNYLD